MLRHVLITEDEMKAMQQVVAHFWTDEERDFEGNRADDHIFTSLASLRGFLEQEGVEVFPEPEWHKNFEQQPRNGGPATTPTAA